MSLPPSGEIPQGAIRFNTDSQKLEFYAQDQWWVMSTEHFDLASIGGTLAFAPNARDVTLGARMIVAGGNHYEGSTSVSAEIQYLNIASTGNTQDFGTNLTQARRRLGGMASATRGVFSGGATPSNVNTQDFVEFASTGTCTAWGDTANNTGTCEGTGFSNSTRGIVKSGYQSPGIGGTMDYITIASAGNTQDFGDLSKHGDSPGAAGNSTRALIGGALQQNPSTVAIADISFVTIPTLGNNVDFGGDLTLARWSCFAVSNKTRTVWAGGSTPSTQNVIDYEFISSLGNAINFGDLTTDSAACPAASNCIRGVFAGGYRDPNGHASANIDYIEIVTEGNSVDFGDLSVQNDAGGAGVSNGHGGL